MKKIILGLIMGVMALSASAMTFEVKKYTDDGVVYISAWGPVVPDDGDKLRAFIAKHKFEAGTTMWLHSGGGDIFAAQEMAKQIRLGGFNTAVGGLCLSACTDMYLGGNERYLVGEGQLGYHAASMPNEYLAQIADLYILEIGQFLGVSEVYFGLQYITPGKHINYVKLLFDTHQRADSSIMMYPSARTLFDAGVVTSVIK